MPFNQGIDHMDLTAFHPMLDMGSMINFLKIEYYLGSQFFPQIKSNGNGIRIGAQYPIRGQVDFPGDSPNPPL
jgi:hypothetical protein